MKEPIDELRRATVGNILYACVPDGPEFPLKGISRHTCSQCLRTVIATPSVLADKRALAASLKRELEIICIGCAGEGIAKGSTLVEFPSEVEAAESDRLMGGRPKI